MYTNFIQRKHYTQIVINAIMYINEVWLLVVARPFHQSHKKESLNRNWMLSGSFLDAMDITTSNSKETDVPKCKPDTHEINNRQLLMLYINVGYCISCNIDCE